MHMHHLRLISFLFIAVTAVSIASAQSTDKDPEKQFYRLTDSVTATYNAGEYERAEKLSQLLLTEAESWKTNWNYGNAIHAANIVLGRVALARGDVDEAKQFLLKAGQTPGSPQLDTFGPDMVFAKEMLKKGERETVLAYFDLCEKFWNKVKHSKLDEWRAAIAKNETPDFGANLRYFF